MIHRVANGHRITMCHTVMAVVHGTCRPDQAGRDQKDQGYSIEEGHRAEYTALQAGS